jgi:hypothetical protein
MVAAVAVMMEVRLFKAAFADFHLAGIAFQFANPSGSASRWVSATKSGGQWILPQPDVLPTYGIHFCWDGAPHVPADVFDRITHGQGRLVFRMKLPTNTWSENVQIASIYHGTWSPLHPGLSGKAWLCLRVRGFHHYWGIDGDWPHKVQIAVTDHKPVFLKGGRRTYEDKTYISDDARIKSGPSLSFFAEALYPTFKHARCSDCHAMGSSEAIFAQHEANNVFPGYPSMLTPDNDHPCFSCHFPEWEAPAFSKGINWSEMTSPKQVCDAVRVHLPTSQALRHHFFNDPRVKWAVTDAGIGTNGKQS